jgi:hypothetical protein
MNDLVENARQIGAERGESKAGRFLAYSPGATAHSTVEVKEKPAVAGGLLSL